MAFKNVTYLVVDDFEVMRKVTAGQLRTLGAARVLTAVNGADALRVLRKDKPDLVLCDLNMPVMSGLELLKAVRADAQWCHLPFIVITAETDRQLIQEVIDAGVSDLLVKPYTTDRLAKRIEKALTALPAKAASAPLSTVTVPATQPVQPAKPAPARVPQASDVPHNLLIVDDNVDNLYLMSQLFKDNYQVRVANNGERAVAVCASNQPPDLVLLDIMMPGIDGFEVARQMRANPASENIPIIFVTALSDHEARLKGLVLGAVDFVSKPIEPQTLQLRVDNFMRYVTLHKQLQADYDNMLELARLRTDVEQMTRHDMRGPLAGALGLVQSVLQNHEGVNTTEVEQLRLVEETVLQVLNMINLSAEIFKIETGRFKLNAQPVLIGDILRRIAQMARITYAAKELVLRTDTDTLVGKEPPQAWGDALFCYSLFQNLIKNACEAAPAKSRVVVSLSDTDPLRVMIMNSGAVPLEQRAHFFEKFTTLHKAGGTGLGTYSAKLLVEAQGGQIALEVSDDDNTTTLWVTLPRCPQAP